MLTNNQLATLKAAIQADPTANGYLVAGDTFSLLQWCNGASATLAWSVSVQAQTSDEAATYTAYDSLAAGKRDSWSIFLLFARNFSKNKIRNWITDVWGNATAGSIAESILQAGTEFATRAQNVFGGNTKTTGTVTALDRSFTGLVDQTDANKLVAV